MKNYLIIGAIVLVSIVGIWILAERSDEQADLEDTETTASQTPETYDPSQEAAETMEFTSEYNPSLKLSYPVDWNVTEGTDNSAEQQLVTFESPMDLNGYYFCLDLTEVSAASDADFATSDADVLSVDSFMAQGVGKELSSVTFNVEENGNLLWSVIDGSPALSDMSFQNQITNPSGRRLQTLGRFNCRETNSPVKDLELFDKSRWSHDAKAILRSLSY